MGLAIPLGENINKKLFRNLQNLSKILDCNKIWKDLRRLFT